MCVCALHIRWSTLVIHTALLWRGAIWQKLSNTEKMLRSQVISQQNTQTENQNIVTMCHIKKCFKNSIKIENIENIRYFRTKISDIYPIYINDIYRRYIYQANSVFCFCKNLRWAAYVICFTAEVEMRAGENVSLDGHQNTMSFHQTTLSPPMRSRCFVLLCQTDFNSE